MHVLGENKARCNVFYSNKTYQLIFMLLQRLNRSIKCDVILPQKCGSECGALLWRRRAPNCDLHALVNLNSFRCTTASNIYWENLHTVCILVSTNLFGKRHFRLLIRNLPLLPALYGNMRKNYIGVHIYVHGAEVMQWNFTQIFLLYIGIGAHNLSRRFFWDFSPQFHR